MELQLKHLSPYLIHNVKFYLPIESERFKSILENEPYSHIEFEWAIENDFNRAKEYLSMYFTQDSPFICYEDNELFIGQMKSNLGWEEDDVYLREMKLCLHPLSDLTKEIEVNGEKFVPMDIIKIYHYCTIDSNGIVTESGEEYGVKYLPYTIVEMLISWHFDVFGLIESGLAIDAKTLNQK